MTKKEIANIAKIELDDEDGLLTSKKIHIPPIHNSVEIWIDKERINQVNFSKNQAISFSDFLEIDEKEIELMYSELKKYAGEMILNKEITKKSITCTNSFELNYRAVIVPQQNKTPKKYIVILADTNWKIRYSDFVLEIEILFEDNKFIFLQEYSGIWTRLEWWYGYNTKENNYKTKS